MIIGVVIHELFDYLMCLITNTPVDKVNIKDKIKREKDPVYRRYEIKGNLFIKRKNLILLQASRQNITKMAILND